MHCHSIKIAPEPLYSSKNVFLTAKNDRLLQFYLSSKPDASIDVAIIFGATVSIRDKTQHIETVMFSLYANDKMKGYSHGLQGLSDPKLNHLLQMVEPENSINYDLSELLTHVRTLNHSVSREIKAVDLMLWLTLHKLADEEICRRISLVLYKLSTLERLTVEQSALLREIRMYVKMLGLVHLKHVLALISASA